jgi:putative transcriptional regulator
LFFFFDRLFLVSTQVNMKISYKKLWLMLVEKEISPVTLRRDLSLSTGTMTKLRKNEEVALSVLLRICGYLGCNIGDICDALKDEND